MTDLENNINPAINNTENTNSEIVQINDLKSNLGEITESQQVDNNLGTIPDSSSDNISSNEQPFPNKIENITADGNNNSFETPTESSIQETPQTNTLEKNQGNESSQTTDSTPESMTSNIESTVITNPEESQNGLQINNTLSENPTIGENSPLEGSDTEEQQTKASQKEKLLQLIKAHESKAQKSGFTKGILTGAAAMILIVAAGGFFAKDQIIDVLNSIDNTSSLNANVIDLTENNNEEIDSEVFPEDEYSEDNESLDIEEFGDYEYNEEALNNENNYEYNEDLNSENYNEIFSNNEEIYSPENNETTNNAEFYENVNEESDSEIINNDSEESNNIDTTYKNDKEEEQAINPLLDGLNIFDWNKLKNEENGEIKTEEGNETTIEVEDETIDNEEIIDNDWENEELSDNNNPYTINHVDSVEEANWVLPAHCSDLTCYGEDKEFAPCTTFKPNEKLEENSNRIGNNGVCRYKDPSELVYVEFN